MRRELCATALLLVAVLLPGTAAPAGGNSPEPKDAAASPPGDRLIIHEWGTFTSLQDEAGQSVAGVNTDDEAVPAFVHRISDLVPQPSELAPVYYKGVPRSHRQVRMRLETPVLYFYPPAGTHEPLHASVQVGFRGGWLTEYFPAAHVTAPGLKEGNFRFEGLTPNTLGTLEWNDLTIGGNYELPDTKAPVWLAPRQVRAATVRAPGGEAEKYLFYRGVGNLASPLTVSRSRDDKSLVIREEIAPSLGLHAPLLVRAMWLVHVREDGTVAFRPLGAAKLTGESGHEIARTPVDFPGAATPSSRTPLYDKTGAETLIGGYAKANLARLRDEMRKQLIADGLYVDEAEAMLKTWELAYFKSPGLRLFYVLPQAWTDAVLPLQCSLLADVSRTMVGRVELVTPKQRALLKQLGAGPVSKINWFYERLNGKSDRNEMMAQLWEGKARFEDLKISIPPDYQAYIALGRFRNALILDDHTRHPHSGLERFVEAYNLSYYTPDDEAEPKTANK
jgi:hypothetical protein